MSTLGQRIKLARIDAGLTQKQLADAAGVGSRTIGRYERSESTPDASTLKRIAEATGKDVSYFTPTGDLQELGRHIDYEISDRDGSLRLRVTMVIEVGPTKRRRIDDE